MLRLRSANLTAAVRKFADTVLKGAGHTPTVAIGPVVWAIEGGHDQKHWYFVLGSADKRGRFRVDQFNVGWNDQDFANDCQAAMIAELIGRPPCVIHTFEDELAMIRFCETVWPCAKTRQIRASIEQERASA
jgi:hypothetical protein